MFLINSGGAPTVATNDATVTGSTGTFNGEGASFPAGDTLEVSYKYGVGTLILPASPLETPHKTITAVSGTTPIPGFNVTRACAVHVYQVKRDSRAISYLSL